MKQISTFEEFEAAVIKKTKGDSLWVVAHGAVLGGVLSTLCGGPIGAIMSPSVNLNTEMYLNYLETEYKQRFEENKNDSQYVQSLIKEAVDKIRTLV